MTPNEAALAVGVSRRTVERAIKSGRLRARQGNDRAWSIEPEALDRWADAHAPRTRQRMRHDEDVRTPESHALSHAQELRIAQERVAKVEAMLEREAARVGKAELRAEAAEAEVVRLRERQDALAAERWREVSALLARLAPPPESPRGGWWPWRRRASGAA